MKNLDKSQIAKLNREKQKTYFDQETYKIHEKFKEEIDKLKWDFSKRNMLQGGGYLLGYLKLKYKQLKEISETFLKSLLYGVETDKYIDKSLQDSLLKNLSRFIGSKNRFIDHDMKAEINKIDAGPSVNHSVNMKQSQEYISILNHFHNRLKKEIFDLNEKYNNNIKNEIKGKEQIKNENYINLGYIDQLKSYDNLKFDLNKLISLCEELNIAYNYDCFFSIGILTRMILDHVPPIFKSKTLIDAASNWTKDKKSFKQIVLNLEKFNRKIYDLMLHSKISEKSQSITFEEVDSKNGLNLLISEIISLLSDNKNH